MTDGVTNASLPKNSTIEELTLASALQLLADRAAAGPTKKQLRKAAKKKSAARPEEKSREAEGKGRSEKGREEKSGAAQDGRSGRIGGAVGRRVRGCIAPTPFTGLPAQR